MTKNYFRRFVWSFLALLGVTVSALAVKGVVGNSLQTDEAERTVLYSWEGNADGAIESGGTATATTVGDVTDKNTGDVVDAAGADLTSADINMVNSTYRVIRLRGANDFSTYVINVALDKELKAGDSIAITGYRNKNAADKQSGALIKFEKGSTTASTGSTGLEFVNIDQSDASAADQNRGTEPNTVKVLVPESAEGSKSFTMTRAVTATNLFITKIEVISYRDAEAAGGEGNEGGEGGEGSGEGTTASFHDFSVNLVDILTADQKVEKQAQDMYVAVAEDGTVSQTDAAEVATNVVHLVGTYWNSHGWTNTTATVKVDGPVAITLGRCGYGGGDIIVKNADGETVAQGAFENAGSGNYCYSAGKPENSTTVKYDGGATTLTITYPSYLPYIAVASYDPSKEWKWRDLSIDMVNGALTAEQRVDETSYKFGLVADDEGNLTQVDATADYANIVLDGKYWNSHGWNGTKATFKVEGPVEVSLGNCYYGSGTATLKNAAGEQVASVSLVKENTCWEQDHSSVVTMKYTGEATTLTLEYNSYLPYIGVKAIDPATLVDEATVSFAAGEATGAIVPASQKKEVGKTITLPTNYTMYVEGKTLTGWSDGTNTYAPGAEFTVPESDIELTPVFTVNEVSLADRTDAVTVNFNLEPGTDIPAISIGEGKTGFRVAQAIVNGTAIDVKMDVDNTYANGKGKLNNSGRDSWCQANGETKITIPSCKGAVVEMKGYNAFTTTTIDGQNDYTSGQTISYTVSNKADNVDIILGSDCGYLSYIKVTLPYIEPSAAGTVFDNVNGTITWPIGNETTPTVSDDIKVGISNAAVSIGSALTTKVASYVANSNSMLQCQPGTSNPGKDANNMVEYIVKSVKGVTMNINSITFDAIKIGTNNATFSYTTVVDGVEGDAVTVAAADILRNDNSNASTAVLGHTITVNSEANTFAVRFYISGFADNKQCAIGNVVINATLNGTVADVEKYSFSATPNAEGAGNVTVYPSANEYEAGSEITLTAAENFGYDFVNWTNAAGEEVSAEAKFTYIVNASDALTANFKKVNTYELALTIEGGAADYMVAWSPEPTVVDGKTMYEEGTQVTLTASNNTIFTFNSWSDGNTFTENKLTMNENKAITATFSAVDFIAAWDFIVAGANGRAADFASQDNTSATLILRDADGNTQSWLDKSKAGDKNTYEGRYCAVNWKSLDAKYYYQTKVNAKNFTNIKVKSEMLYNYNAYETQKLEYSLDGETWTTLTSVTLPTRAWTDVNADLPTTADHAETLYLRWIPDYDSEVKGSSGNDGTSLANIFILADADVYDDGVAPILVSTIPAENSSTASATGKIVLNFDEKVKLTDNAKATLNGKDIELTVSGQTVSAAYKNLDYSTEYVFSLAAGSVADLTDNTLNEAVTINFTTMVRPTVEKGQYDFIVPEEGSFEDAIAAATARADKSKRFYIFVKKGEYFLEGSGEELTIERKNNGVLLKTDYAKSPITTISTPNVSIIGESMDETILWNLPESDEANNRNGEGIGTTATIFLSNAAVNTYMQDITLKNAYPYAPGTTGRAVCLQDKSDKTVAKNVKLLSHQDTYYSNNSSARFYWEDCELHGDVDFLCGGGDVYYNRCNLVIEKRDGNVIAAPNGQKKYGYVFLDCEINPVNDDAISTVNGKFNLGRPWGAGCRAQYINTKMNILPTAYAWAEMGGNMPSVFAEYNSTDKNDNKIDLSTRKLTFDGGTQASAELTEAQVEELSIANVMGGDDSWDPTLLTEQAPAVKNVVLDGNNLTWDDSNYALLYAIVKNGDVVAFTTENSFDISTLSSTLPHSAKASSLSANAAAPVWAVRAANEMGGLNEAVEATQADAVSEVKAEETVSVSNGKVFNVAGQEVSASYKGIVIIDGKKVIK